MSSHDRQKPIHADFCGVHLRFVMSCSEATIADALASLPDYDLGRLRRVLDAIPLQGAPEPGRRKAG